MINTRQYFIMTLGATIGVGLLVQNTSLMYKHLTTNCTSTSRYCARRRSPLAFHSLGTESTTKKRAKGETNAAP